MAQKTRDPHHIVDIVERSLGRALDADLIADVRHLTVGDLETVKAEYDKHAAEFEPRQPAEGEFWPFSRRLIQNYHERDPVVAEAATQRVIGQLLFAHGAFATDELGYLLTQTLNPKHVGSPRVRWLYRSDDPQLLANYFEALAYLRPLLDSGLLILVPRAVAPHPLSEDLVFLEGDEHHVEAWLCAAEMCRGHEARRVHEEAVQSGGPVPVPDTREQMLAWAFDSLFKKLDALARGFPGHLNLESEDERAAFDWLVRQTLPAATRQRRGEALTAVEMLALPGVPGLQPQDVVALHQSEVWHDYRLALQHALERIAAARVSSQREARALLREELHSVERSATKTTRRSKFLEERKQLRRDLLIGAVVAGGAAPLIGAAAALGGLGIASARSAGVLLWSWLGTRNDDSDLAVAQCFGAFREAPTAATPSARG
jgi:hypothetical protein